jgi:four helix bundle protein
MFQAYEVSLSLIRAVQPLAAVVRVHDASLADQLRRAATSVTLNISEARKRLGKDRVHLWSVASGSAEEVKAALQVAQAWGYVDGPSLEEALALNDRVLAMLWRLTHRR